MATTIKYFISPPPKIIFGNTNNIITKKIKINNKTKNEYRFKLFSKYPNTNNIIESAIKSVFGINLFLQSI